MAVRGLLMSPIFTTEAFQDKMIQSEILLATKESLRQALLKVHECPTISAVHKLNGYFMSGEFELASRQSEERLRIQ